METGKQSSNTNHAPGPIEARGALLGDFEIVGNMPPAEVPGAIERDRAIFVARPGFYRKLIPLRIESDGRLFSGGRYLFRSFAEVVDFHRWFRDEFRLDGKLLVERPWVKDFSRLAFRVLGAHDFKDVHRSQVVVRAERWALSGERAAALEAAWPAVRDRAAHDGLAGVWLLYSEELREAGLGNDRRSRWSVQSGRAGSGYHERARQAAFAGPRVRGAWLGAQDF